jgi:hypothetical protein
MSNDDHNDGFNPRILKICSWCGVIFFLMWLGGAGPLSGWLYLPPPSAADTAATTLADYTSRNLMLMRIGITIANFSCVFYLAWGMVVTLLVKKVEGDYPILFYIQVVSLAACVVVILYIAYFWGAAMWRPGETSPDVTQVLNDLGWLGVLYTGAPFASYQIALAIVTLMDKSERPVYPRWSAYVNLFVSFFMFEAAGILLFKTGPFSQNGLFVFYVPMSAFFLWILLFSYLAHKAVNTEVTKRATV